MLRNQWHLGRRIYGIPSIMMRFVDGSGEGGAGDGGTGDDGKGDPAPKTYTQAEVDELTAQAKKEGAESAAAEAKKQAKPEEKKAEPKVAPDGKHPKAEPEPDAKLEAANGKLVKAAARAAALELGIPAVRADYAVRMADLTGVRVDDSGDPDAEAAKKAVEKVLTDIPELKGAAGFRVGAPDADKNGSGNKKMSYHDAVAAHYKK